MDKDSLERTVFKEAVSGGKIKRWGRSRALYKHMGMPKQSTQVENVAEEELFQPCSSV